MKIETLEKLEPLLKRRNSILETLYRIENTKEFLTLSIEGEDGAERTSTVHFKWQEASDIPKKVREYMLGLVEAELKEVNALIEAI